MLVALGVLRLVRSPLGRPLLRVAVHCPGCRRVHEYPWSRAWGTPTLAMFAIQAGRCPSAPGAAVAVGVAAAALEAAAEVHAQAVAEATTLRDRREAASRERGTEAPRPVGPSPAFLEPPVGAPRG